MRRFLRMIILIFALCSINNTTCFAKNTSWGAPLKEIKNWAGSVDGPADKDKNPEKYLAESKCWYMLTQVCGYNEIQAAGIMGNFEGEGKFLYGAVQGYYFYVPDKGFKPPAKNSGGTAMSLCQWDKGRRDNYVEALKKNNLWDMYCGDSENDEICIFTYSFLMQDTKNDSIAKVCLPDSETFKKCKTPEEAEKLWEDKWERPANKHYADRGAWAKEYYKRFKGTIGTKPDGASGGNAQSVQTEQLYEKYTQSIIKLYEDHTLQIFTPEESDLWDMSGYDRSRVDDIGGFMYDENGTVIIPKIRVAFMLFGILLVVYMIVMYLCYWFDKMNNILELSMLRLVTFGKLSVGDDEYNLVDKDTKQNFVDTKQMTIICIGGLIIGILILSGKIFELLAFIMTKLGKLGG